MNAVTIYVLDIKHKIQTVHYVQNTKIKFPNVLIHWAYYDVDPSFQRVRACVISSFRSVHHACEMRAFVFFI